MSYDVVAFETDEQALALSETEEGLFHRMIRKAWINGSVPADMIKLADLIRTRPSTLRKAWPNLSKMWTPIDEDFSRLINKKQEIERIYREKIRDANSVAGKLSAKARKEKEHSSTVVERASNERSTSPLSSPPLPSEGNNTGEGKGDSAGLKNAVARPRDLASDFYAEKCLELTQTPYVCETGDFVMLAKLRKAFGTQAKDKPPGWDEAVVHYFGSPLSQYSLADLANPKRYAVFRNSALDGYNKPVNHKGNGNGNESREERVARRNREITDEFNHELFGATGNSDGDGVQQGAPGLVLPGFK